MAIFQHRDRVTVSPEAVEQARLNDQVVLTGNNEAFVIADGIFFVEFFEAAAGTTITITDGNSQAIVAGIASFSNDHSPIRCDKGLTITGNLVMLKGFVLRGIFS